MARVTCPQCGKPNPEELETCQFCGAELKPPQEPAQENPWSFRPGEEPVKKHTSEFEKVSLQPRDKEPIHPGEAPTKKNTAELERALPSWLRSLRGKGQDDASGGDQTPESPASGEIQPGTLETPAPAQPPLPPADENLPDWIGGLGSASADEEEIPDWLSNLRNKDKSEEKPAFQAGSADFGQPPAAQEPFNPPPAGSPPASSQDENLPDWLQQTLSKNPPPAAETPAPGRSGPGSGRLSSLSVTPVEPPPAPAEEVPDWLNQLKESAADSQPEQPLTPTPESTPDWLSNLPQETSPAAAEAAPAAAVPDWLSKLEMQAGTDASVEIPPAFVEETPPAAPAGTPEQTPDWLAKLQADVASTSVPAGTPEEFEAASEPSPSEPAPAETLPDWLSSIDQAAAPTAEGPALIVDEADQTPGNEGKAAFSMETPDWLSNLKPEQGTDATQPAQGESGQSSDSLKPADLPSWVQAMRPVEAIVSEAAPLPMEEGQTENQGPLAGLRAVLPASPGWGPMRKPPAYSMKLQTTDSQQRYAAHLEKLISSELEPLLIKSERPISGKILRWIVAILMILAVGLSVTTGILTAPPIDLYPPEGVGNTDPQAPPSMFKMISGLPASSPVLVVFDYEPALSGELEAAAAPVVDHLLLSGALLTFVSTSPTGPVLAEQFLHDTQAGHNLQAGEQYINLGYLAGGPAGIASFARSPSTAAPLAWSTDPAVNGQVPWKTESMPPMPPLLGVQQLSDFKAVLVLTDNPDIARDWIEQAGPDLGDKPMAMVISAQAEPMLRPYYDSGQIQGLVTGLAGGKAYEQAINHTGVDQAYWNAFSVGMLVAEGLILAGGLWGAFGALRNRKKKTGEKG